MQVKDFETREVKMKSMHESMLTAVQESRDLKTNQSITSLTEVKEEYEVKLDEANSKVASLTEKLKEQEFNFKNLQLQMESKEIEFERKAHDLVLDKRNLENQIKRQ